MPKEFILCEKSAILWSIADYKECPVCYPLHIQKEEVIHILDIRKTQIEKTLKAICSSENQPHQWIDDWEQVYDVMFFL